MFRVHKCTQNCGDGCVGIWRCSDNKTLILRCDECYASWLNPEDVSTGVPVSVNHPDDILPGTSLHVFGGRAGWATREEIEKAGWMRFVTGESKALDEVWKEAKERGDVQGI